MQFTRKVAVTFVDETWTLMLTSSEKIHKQEEFPQCVHFQPLPDLEIVRLGNDPASLAMIIEFISKAKKVLKTKRAVAISVTQCGKDLANAALLAGCYLILCHEFTIDAVIDGLSPISSELLTYDEVTVHACLSAFFHAKELGWFKHSPSLQDVASTYAESNDCTYDFLEYLHYNDPANGNFHFVIPRRLLIFHEPQLPCPGPEWKDVEGRRNFSAEYYADLFGDFDVRLVLRVVNSGNQAQIYPPTAFTDRGIAVDELALDGGRPSALQSLDRFLSILRHIPGAVAVHGGRAGLGDADALIAACLISCHGFTPLAAVAWLQMAHPSAAARRRPTPRPAPAKTDAMPLAKPAGWPGVLPANLGLPGVAGPTGPSKRPAHAPACSPKALTA
jgi:hypothetical protein